MTRQEAVDILEKKGIYRSGNETFRYMLLGRLKSDCEAYIHRKGAPLWAKDPEEQTLIMRALYISLDEKPVFLSMSKIDAYRDAMEDILRQRQPKNTDPELLIGSGF